MKQANILWSLHKQVFGNHMYVYVNTYLEHAGHDLNTHK